MYTFKPATQYEISKILLNIPNKQSDSDLWLLKKCASVLVPTIINIEGLGATYRPTLFILGSLESS